MSELDLNKIKYYPDRFYICLDGFDTDNLISFLTNLEIGKQQSVFIHEYYHYLTNIATFSGIRQFDLNFCDRFRLSTILTFKHGIDSYPINQNVFPDCKDDVDYWNAVMTMINDDDIDFDLVTETHQSPNRKFNIDSIKEVQKPLNFVIDGKQINGARILIEITISGLLNTNSFNLTYGAIDEFLSSAIDEYLFENDFSDISPSELSQRPFYPYGLFDELLNFYGITKPTAFEKILIAYTALDSKNPPVKIIEILNALKNGGYEEFQNDPENILLKHVDKNTPYQSVLNNINEFSEQAYKQGRIHISQALKYYYDKFYSAQKFKEQDFFYFIRPFFADGDDVLRKKQRFLLGLSRIINQFSPPVILKDGIFRYVDKLTTFGEATLLMIASYEIYESLRTNRIATRPIKLKAKYTFPDGNIDCDNIETFQPPPIRSVFQLALNEINLYALYLKEAETLAQKDELTKKPK